MVINNGMVTDYRKVQWLCISKISHEIMQVCVFLSSANTCPAMYDIPIEFYSEAELYAAWVRTYLGILCRHIIIWGKWHCNSKGVGDHLHWNCRPFPITLMRKMGMFITYRRIIMCCDTAMIILWCHFIHILSCFPHLTHASLYVWVLWPPHFQWRRQHLNPRLTKGVVFFFPGTLNRSIFTQNDF